MSPFVPPPAPDAPRAKIEAAHRADEAGTVRALLDEAAFAADAKARVDETARTIVTEVRKNRRRFGGLDVYLAEYGLTSEEGIVLMCLAESLLRVPDAATADKLIRDKIGGADWAGHLGHSASPLVNASTWALLLTGQVVRLEEATGHEVNDLLRRLVARSGEPVIRQAMVHAMRVLGRQFVIGETIDDALDAGTEDASVSEEGARYRYSFDMLGEAAMTAADAERYLTAYRDAIAAIGGTVDRASDFFARPGISVKLSALHPRYEYAQRERVMAELAPRLIDLCVRAKAAGIGLCVDAEEADRLELSLDVFEVAAGADQLTNWDGLGLAVQAYQKRARPLLDWLAELARTTRRRLMVRLVKGAYWDSEIKRAQVGGYDGYPVFTRKEATDVSYIACARRLFAEPDLFYPQFATHNAHTVAAIIELAGGASEFEFQRLHGMGEPLYDHIVGGAERSWPCRVYAPVGGYADLLAYLVRRLLENGANTSFVHRLADDAAPIEEIVADPCDAIAALGDIPHPAIPLPAAIYGAARRNSRGIDLADPSALRGLAGGVEGAGPWRARPIVGGDPAEGEGTATPVTNPAHRKTVVGECVSATVGEVAEAAVQAAAAQPAWDARGGAARAEILERAADGLEDAMAELIALCVPEAGKTLDDAVAEVREAADFCRYYAERARAEFEGPQILSGPTGEENAISLHGKGVFGCISPWNFPLAIFTGQVAAALAAGNSVLAKPAEQTPLIAARAVEILHAAGVPGDVLHFLPGSGGTVGVALATDPRLAGIAFTGSVATAHAINRTLAEREGSVATLIAETGGQNAMIVDSTALPEQVVRDAVTSAFRSAGQRCSALRILCLQDDIADQLIEMLVGRMAEITVGDPASLASDVGPVIDEDAHARLAAHAQRMEREAKLLHEVALPDGLAPEGLSGGTFFAPRAFEIDEIGILEGEVFGPILHVVRYQADGLDGVIDAINGTGFGLTLGIHSRVDATIERIRKRARVGNTYVNRNMIGSVVGVQPFGGEGLSGTGAKAGGPRTLHRYAVERTVAVDTTAAGGNATLLALGARDGEGGS